MMASKNTHGSAQATKFADAARELGCDESEKAFNAALKRVATHKPASEPPKAEREPKTKKPAK